MEMLIGAEDTPTPTPPELLPAVAAAVRLAPLEPRLSPPAPPPPTTLLLELTAADVEEARDRCSH